MNNNHNQILENLDNQMNQLMQEHENIYDSFGRDYKEEVSLHMKYEASLTLGNSLVDSLIETALLHRRMIMDIAGIIKKHIYNGEYDKANLLLDKTTQLIRYVEVNSVAGKIQTEMKKLMES